MPSIQYVDSYESEDEYDSDDPLYQEVLRVQNRSLELIDELRELYGQNFEHLNLSQEQAKRIFESV